MNLKLFKERNIPWRGILGLITGVAALVTPSIILYQKTETQTKAYDSLQSDRAQVQQLLEKTNNLLETTEASFSAYRATDQIVRNNELEKEIADIQKVYKTAVDRYEELLSLRLPITQSQPLEKLLTKSLVYLSQRNYSSASAELLVLDNELEKLQQQAEPKVAANVQAIKEAPSNGFRQQRVDSDVGSFVVDIIAADMNSTRVVVETASSGDCHDNCPVDALASYVSKAGGYAGINGPYFCPAEYPSCAGKTNSFDTLIMNRNKVYFNSDNNVYSTVPAIIFLGSSARVVSRSLEWGRDTGVDAVIAAQPLVLFNGQVSFGGDGDPKKGSRGSRSFIGVKDNMVYIGRVQGATVVEVGHVLKAMGLQHALNLDSGGSTALYLNGRYLAGPGRQTPFGIVFVRK